MIKIKVLLAVRPKMLADVVRNMVERQPDMEVVGEAFDPIKLLLAVGTTLADVVLIAPLHSEGEPKLCRHLLAEYPPLKIVTLSGKEDAAVLYASGCGKKCLDESSEPSILGAMRASCNQT